MAKTATDCFAYLPSWRPQARASTCCCPAAVVQDWTDAASRDMAMPYLQQLLCLNPLADVEQQGADMSDSDDEAAEAGAAAGLQLAGNSGDGMFEAAVVQLVLAVQGAGGGFMVAMLNGIASLAAAAGLLAKPGSDAGAGMTGVQLQKPQSIFVLYTSSRRHTIL